MTVLLLSAVLAGSGPVAPLLQKMYDTVYMTGSFQETDLWALTLEEDTSSGTMYLAQPDLFRLSYEDGGATGYDGSVLYTVEPDQQQVMVYSTEGQESFLHLLEACDDSIPSDVVCSGGDSVMVSLQGDFGEGINEMTVGFTLSDSLPYFFSTTDYNGNTTAYRLRDIVTAGEYPQGVFSFTVPEGYQVIQPEEM